MPYPALSCRADHSVPFQDATRRAERTTKPRG